MRRIPMWSRVVFFVLLPFVIYSVWNYVEFRRLQSRHPQLVGALQQRIQRADLGASGTFYRLGVGPLGSKDQASRLCNSLIAAGEKDCLVRRQ